MLPKVTVFFAVLVVMTKYLTGNNLRKDGFILAHSSRRNIPPQQEWKPAGHTLPTVRKQHWSSAPSPWPTSSRGVPPLKKIHKFPDRATSQDPSAQTQEPCGTMYIQTTTVTGGRWGAGFRREVKCRWHVMNTQSKLEYCHPYSLEDTS